VTKISEEKISRKNFSKNSRIGYPKNVGKYRLKKERKHVFYKQINIVTKKWGKKTRENFFPETQVYRKQTTMEINRQEKVRPHVFINTRISSSKNGGKKREKKFFQKYTNRVSEKCWKKIV